MFGSMAMSGMFSVRGWWRALGVACAVGAGAGCWPEPEFSRHPASLGGQVIVSGPLRGASISVEQIDLRSGERAYHVGDTTTDHDGRFSLESGYANGLLRVIARGGLFIDMATGAAIQLDQADELTSLVWFDLVDAREDVLVSPVGHLVDRRARMKLEATGDMAEAVKDASAHLHRHFGDVDWMRLQMVGLDQPATSPTEPVRAALVQAALSYLARDIAAEAGASAQEVNVFELTRLWAQDLQRSSPPGSMDPGEELAVFDGNDGNERRPDSGLQLGSCAPVEPTCQVLASSCSTGHCRRLCDLYVGTPRALLGGAMTKVIRDNGPGGVNQTGLRIEDTLAIARSVSDNVDPDLFGGSCIETLDRTAPEVRWDEAHSAPADAVVRGVIPLKAIAVDDVDPRPRVQILGYADLDGDPANDVVLANVDTAGAADGPLTVTASAIDLAGNRSMAERRVTVDNTPPQLTLAPAGFLIDGATWWTASAAPTLAGTVVEVNPAAVHATIGATQVAGAIAGGAWSVTLPAGAIDLAGANVTIRITDRAGNHAELTQRIRHDASAPALSFQASTVHDEAAEVPAFTADESPIHNHNGAPIDLAASGACPRVTKYSYLLGAASPAYVTENPARNPIAYKLVSADDGVGIVEGSTQYRVLRREAGGAAVLLDWTSAGAGAPIAAGARLFDVAVVSGLVAGLGTTEATYDVEFRAADRLARTAIASRCFELRIKAPPLHFTEGGRALGHTFALDSLSLLPGAQFDLLAARLLNNDATGASLLDQRFSNGTAETVVLTVTVTKPDEVTATQAFVIRNHSSSTPVNIHCGTDEDPNPACEAPSPFPGPGYSSQVNSATSRTLMFPARLYELNAAGVPTTQIPCLAPCSPGGSVFRFAVPPRAAGAPARRFVVMTMIGQVSTLWPKDGGHDASPPFLDSSINGVRYTGMTQFDDSGCTNWSTNWAYCQVYTSRTQYRALTYAKLTFASETKTTYATAATPQIAPIEAAPPLKRLPIYGWDTSEPEGTLP